MTSEERAVCICGQRTTHAYPVRVGIGKEHRGWLFVCASCLEIERATFGEPETVRRLADGPGCDVWERIKMVLSDGPLPVRELAAEANAGERHVKRVLSEHRADVAAVAMVGQTKMWGLAAAAMGAVGD